MYSNIGGKLRALAGILGSIGIIAIGIGLIMIFIYFGNSRSHTLVPGLILGVVGLIEVISTWPLYAFGQLVEDVHAIKNGSHATLQSDELPDL